MAAKRNKPQGRSGPIVFSGEAAQWRITHFPQHKDDRENFIARLFVQVAERRIRKESVPSFKPFTGLLQNSENDLDFSIQTADGPKLLELAEFAPLQTFGPTFASAPTQLATSEKVEQALELIRAKSGHQGGKNRLLLLYATERAFELDMIAIELLRRVLAEEAPRFDRVYFIQPVGPDVGIATEVFPAVPHEWFADLSDDGLMKIPIVSTHPADMIIYRAWDTSMLYGAREVNVRIGVSYHEFYRL